MLAQLLHVRADEHLTQLDKVTVLLVVHLNHTPRVRAAAHRTTVRGLAHRVRADDGEGDLGLGVSAETRLDAR